MERLAKKDFKANGILPESETRRTVVEGLVKLGASEIKIEGRRNLAIVKEKLEHGVPVLGIADHLSNADGPVFNSVLGKAGIKDPIFVFGIKLARNPLTNVFIRSANTLPVWPPSLEVKNEKEEDMRKKMNEQAMHSAQAALNGGRLLIVFPEGGRSYDGVLHRGLPQIGGYFQMVDNLEVFPMAVWETEKRLPRKRGWPHRGPVSLAFGEVFKAKDLPGYGQRGKVARSEMVDAAMLKVASLLPEQYRGYYSDVARFKSVQNGADTELLRGEEVILRK